MENGRIEASPAPSVSFDGPGARAALIVPWQTATVKGDYWVLTLASPSPPTGPAWTGPVILRSDADATHKLARVE